VKLINKYKFSVFSGTNYFKEYLLILKYIINFFSKKNYILEYEKKASQLYFKKYAYSFGSGRMALYAGLKALNIKEGDEIIIPPYTCVVVINAILYCKAKPIYSDINLKDFNMNLDEALKKFSARTKAIYIQHTFGNYLNYEKIIQICKDNNIYIIEDCAHYFPKKKMLNSDIVINSSDTSKIYNTYIGGVIFTDDILISNKLKMIYKNSNEFNIFQKLRIIISFYLSLILNSPNIFIFSSYLNSILQKINFYFNFNDEKITELPRKNYPFKIFNFIALIGISQLTNIKKNIDYRSMIVYQIDDILEIYNYKSKAPPLLRYSFLVSDRSKFKKIFSEYNLSIWFTSLFEGRDSDYDKIFYNLGSCPMAEFASKSIVNLPTHKNININKLINTIKKNKDSILQIKI
tara:strand:+ start:477 stop:1691 length:1215 start_codon:yes stop_codon:yes gene_type:complete